MIYKVDALVEFMPANAEWWEVSRTTNGFLARVWVLQKMGEPELDFDAIQKPTSPPDYVKAREDWEDMIYALGRDIRDRMPDAERMVLGVKPNFTPTLPEVERIVQDEGEGYFAWRVSRDSSGIRCRVWDLSMLAELPYPDRDNVQLPESEPKWDVTVESAEEAVRFLAGKGAGNDTDVDVLLEYRARYALMNLARSAG